MEDAASSQDSVLTASEYINSQLELEREARELLPYSFQTCTYSMGPLRQPVYACKAHSSAGAAICYSCSISCHGDCELIELFNKRHIQCDCGTTRLSARCNLRNTSNATPAPTNKYCHNYQGRFCACDTEYEYSKEKGTMYQCLLGDACNEDWFHDTCIVGAEPREGEKISIQANGIVDKPRSVEEISTEMDVKVNGIELEPATNTFPEPSTGPETRALAAPTQTEEGEEGEEPPPAGFPTEEFEHFICWKCVDKNPWLRRYAGTDGFLPAVTKNGQPPYDIPTDRTHELLKSNQEAEDTNGVQFEQAGPLTEIERTSCKRKATDMEDTLMTDESPNNIVLPPSKRVRTPDAPPLIDLPSLVSDGITCKYARLPPSPPTNLPISLFLTSSFRSHFCHCSNCATLLRPLPILRAEEETYEPPLDSENGSDAGDGSSRASMLDMGERALNTMDRVKAIEGVMVYNHLKEKVKSFLKPFAENGVQVSAEDVRRYFEELRGDRNEVGSSSRTNGGGDKSNSSEDTRREQSGY